MSTQSIGARGMGSYIVDGDRQPFEANLIDFRHSVVQAHRRADAGDDTLEICAHCMCEVDVDPQPHRPGCVGIGKARATSTPVLAGLEPRTEVRKKLRPATVLGSARNGLDALERMDDGLPQEPEVGLAAAAAPDAEVLEEREPEVPVEPTSASSAIEPPVAPSRSSSTRRNTRWDRDSIIEAIIRWAAEHAEAPRATQWTKKQDGYPTCSTVISHFGSWTAALVAAGFSARQRGGQPGARSNGGRPKKTSGRSAVGDLAVTGSASISSADQVKETTEGSPAYVAPLPVQPRPEEPAFDLVTLTDDTKAWIDRLASEGQRCIIEADRLNRRAEAIQAISAGLQMLQETEA